MDLFARIKNDPKLEIRRKRAHKPTEKCWQSCTEKSMGSTKERNGIIESLYFIYMPLLAFLLKQPGEYINALDGKVEKKKMKIQRRKSTTWE